MSHVAHGVIAPDEKADFASRLLHLFEGISAVIAEHRPDEAAVEEVFLNTNAQSTLKLGHARAAALIAPARAGLLVAEYADPSGQEGGGRHGRGRQGPDRLHDRPPAAHGRQDHGRLRRRPGRRHHPRQPARRQPESGMIGRLRGAVAEVGEEEALIDVMGVGYVVRCGSRTLQRACRPWARKPCCTSRASGARAPACASTASWHARGPQGLRAAAGHPGRGPQGGHGGAGRAAAGRAGQRRGARGQGRRGPRLGRRARNWPCASSPS